MSTRQNALEGFGGLLAKSLGAVPSPYWPDHPICDRRRRSVWDAAAVAADEVERQVAQAGAEEGVATMLLIGGENASWKHHHRGSGLLAVIRLFVHGRAGARYAGGIWFGGFG